MPTRLLLLACIVATGCAMRVERHGYAIPQDRAATECAMPIRNDPGRDEDAFELLGSIEVSDRFSTDCDEQVVLRRLTVEACQLDADLVNVTEEKRPDFWSTCYRAKADFLRLKDRSARAQLASDEKYAPEDVRKRAQVTHDRQRWALFGGLMGGALGASFVP